MKNLQKGFIAPALLVVIVLLVIGGGVYVYKNKKTETSVIDVEKQQTNQVQTKTNIQNNTLNTNTKGSTLIQNGVLKLSSSQNVIELGNDLSVSIIPQINKTSFGKPVDLELSIIAPDGTTLQTLKTTWPMRIACPGAVGHECPYYDPTTKQSVNFSLSTLPNFRVLESGTYRIKGKTGEGILTVTDFVFKLDSSQAEKIISTNGFGDYKLRSFDIDNSSGHDNYRMYYGSVGNEFGVEVEKTNSQQEAKARSDFYISLPSYAYKIENISFDNTTIKSSVSYGSSHPFWYSGNYFVVVNSYISSSDDFNRVVGEYLKKYPPNINN